MGLHLPANRDPHHTRPVITPTPILRRGLSLTLLVKEREAALDRGGEVNTTRHCANAHRADADPNPT